MSALFNTEVHDASRRRYAGMRESHRGRFYAAMRIALEFEHLVILNDRWPHTLELIKWMEANLSCAGWHGASSAGGFLFGFADANDAFAFRMRWT